MLSISAPACSMVRPGLRRAAASQLRCCGDWRAAAGVSAIGVQSSVAMGKSKLAGITPVTRKFWSSRRMFWPTMAGSAPKRRRHRRSLRTTSRSRPGWSSPAWKPRPSAGWTPSVSKKLALTRACMARSGSPPAPTMLAMPPSHVARFSSVVVLAADVVEIGGGVAIPLVGIVGNALQHHHQGLQVRQGDGLPQQGIADAEDGGGGADAERQGEHRGRGETRRFAQHARAVTNILPQVHKI